MAKYTCMCIFISPLITPLEHPRLIATMLATRNQGVQDKLMGVKIFRPLFPGNPDLLPLFQQLKKQHIRIRTPCTKSDLPTPLFTSPWCSAQNAGVYSFQIYTKDIKVRIEFHRSSRWVKSPSKMPKAPNKILQGSTQGRPNPRHLQRTPLLLGIAPAMASKLVSG